MIVAEAPLSQQILKYGVDQVEINLFNSNCLRYQSYSCLLMTPKNRQNGEFSQRKTSEAETHCSVNPDSTVGGQRVDFACEIFDFLIRDLHFTCLSIADVCVAVHFDHSCACFA